MSATAGTQTNVKRGIFPVLANEALTGLEGRLVKLVNDTNVLEAALPTAQNDLALFVLVLGAAAGSYADVQPLVSELQARVRLNGTCVPGAKLVLDVGSAGDYGKVKTLPSDAGVYLVIGVADEVGADEQLVLMTPCPHLVRVASAHTADVASVTQDALTLTSMLGTGNTAPAAETNIDTLGGTLTGTLDNTLADCGATNGGDVSAVINKNFKEVQAELVTQKALNTVLINDAKTFATQLNAARVDNAAQVTKINAILALLEAHGISLTS
jgi:hypothetical protein